MRKIYSIFSISKPLGKILYIIATQQSINITRLIRETGLNSEYIKEELKILEKKGYICEEWGDRSHIIRFREDSPVSKKYRQVLLKFQADLEGNKKD